MTKLRSGALYLSDDKAIMAPHHYNSMGMRYEQANPRVVLDWRNSESFTETLFDALTRFSFAERDLRDDRRRDWPAYVASGLRTVSEFERVYLRVSIFACNEAGVLFDASVEPKGESNITLKSTLVFGGRYPDVSQDIARLYEVCSKWDLMLF